MRKLRIAIVVTAPDYDSDTTSHTKHAYLRR
jgi:hypothetical protein